MWQNLQLDIFGMTTLFAHQSFCFFLKNLYFVLLLILLQCVSYEFLHRLLKPVSVTSHTESSSKNLTSNKKTSLGRLTRKYLKHFPSFSHILARSTVPHLFFTLPLILLFFFILTFCKGCWPAQVGLYDWYFARGYWSRLLCSWKGWSNKIVDWFSFEKYVFVLLTRIL